MNTSNVSGSADVGSDVFPFKVGLLGIDSGFGGTGAGRGVSGSAASSRIVLPNQARKVTHTSSYS
jgi:hypothetical protein